METVTKKNCFYSYKPKWWGIFAQRYCKPKWWGIFAQRYCKPKWWGIFAQRYYKPKRINFMKRGKYLKMNDIISELKCTEGESSIYNVSSSFFLSFLYIYKFTYLHIKFYILSLYI